MKLARLPKSAAVTRQNLCRVHGCAHAPVHFTDPCAQCPEGHWGATSFHCGRPGPLEIARPCPEPIGPSAPATTGGPGTELKALFGVFGLKSLGGCQCDARAKLMDAKGPRWCSQNIETIVGWLREEADRRKLPFIAQPARLLIRRAIRNAEQKARRNPPA